MEGNFCSFYKMETIHSVSMGNNRTSLISQPFVTAGKRSKLKILRFSTKIFPWLLAFNFQRSLCSPKPTQLGNKTRADDASEFQVLS